MKYDVIVVTIRSEDADGFIEETIGGSLMDVHDWQFLAERVDADVAERVVDNLRVEAV